MISSLILLSATGLFATPVFISDVKASREAGHLRVEVRADGGIDPEGARTVIDDGRLVIYLGGARVRADNRSWELQDGAGEIRAHRHKKETELVVPLTGNGCNGPVELTGSDTGITALVGCEGRVGGGTKAQSGALAPVVVEKRPAAPVAKTAAKAADKGVSLKALVELPDEDEAAAPAATPAPAPHAAEAVAVAVAVGNTMVSPEPAKASAPIVAPAVAPINRVAAAAPVAAIPAAAPAPVRGGAPSVGEAVTAGSPGPIAALASHAMEPAAPGAAPVPASGGSLRAVLLPALLLGALAIAAYLLARRRRGTFRRHIEILETTSLGPKRSLVLARIGDDTLVLGSSEAGITLLRGSSAALPAALAADLVTPVSPAVTVATAQPSASPALKAAPERSTGNDVLETDQPLEEALADIPEPDGARGGQGRSGFRAIEGGLAGLFGKRVGSFQREVAAPPAFDDLLEDSIEDQELRRKLAAGLSSRVR